ncbi:hypothetical protein G7054_g14694 [Neopestalotiopsis clavispora]|nr:hypothetical protein G7054_g14694 [Neopestalotiopsis clavispora]
MATLKSVSYAIVRQLHTLPSLEALHPGDAVNVDDIDLVQDVTLLAVGGYNYVWLVKLHKGLESTPKSTDKQDYSGVPNNLLIDKFVLRLPGHDSLVPNQVTNEVAFRQFVAAKLPHIPVPRVDHFEATDRPGLSFIVEEHVLGSNLSSVWMSLNMTEKESMALQLASITVDLAEVQFEMIGGLDTTTFKPAPTVEGPKLFKGRYKFHNSECYHIGPYQSTKEYILACYDREIHYYTHASADDIYMDLFEDISVPAFVDRLREKRRSLETESIVDEPFVLVHGDFHGRNILTRGNKIVAVLDWEFAGSYPLSESLTSGDIDVVEPDSGELDDENTVWGRKIRAFIKHEVESRGWDRERINMLLGNGNRELGQARTEMIP